uniref:Protein translocase subunit SecY, Protein, membrane protein, PROTEIN TRANSPORT-IMMUNE n=1 Tax=Siphoviridae sp. ctGyV19 TaxID=2826225 RepID=A0A8S5MVE2_9CAUD|nr:MAG TPA: Protein translocase subunit SecY, Protein, membrane protein, PROTEIN TRANSPORT-IMMUNE [Siphoviridae sp. ctGyV19]DAT30348.1 MAG TPA: Protein translocase subunit SecY, Protein, membrane protein, PROTEIN TRANSPORT-IMMUNE [Caudoviricetes sp.]
MATIEIILDVVQIIVSTGIIVVLLKDRKCK